MEEVKLDPTAAPQASTSSPLLQAVEPSEQLDVSAGSEEELPAAAVDWPADDGAASLASPHFATHLWHCVDRVVHAAEQGRQQSKAFVQLVRAKADLDRDYATRLRSLAEKYSASLALPQRPKAANTFQAGCCAIRNLTMNLAANSELLAEKADEDCADAFLSNAQELSELIKPLVAQTKDTQKRLLSATAAMEQAKATLIKACAENDQLQRGGVSSSSNSSSKEVDFLTGLVAATFQSHTPEAVARRVQQADQAYVQAIKRVREVRAEYDQVIKSQLAEFETLEAKRLRESLQAAQNFSRIHQLCYASHLKNVTAVNNTLQNNIRPINDINAFISDSLRQAGKSSSFKPPPLPVYRLFRGHPRFVGSARNEARGVDEPLTDSEADSADEREGEAAEEEEEEEEQTDSSDDANDDTAQEITLSADEDGDADGDVDGLDTDSDDGEEEKKSVAAPPSLQSALAARSRAGAAEALTALQQQALAQTLERVLALPAFSTAAPASPVSLEPERSVVVDLLTTPTGRVAFAAALRKHVREAPVPASASPAAAPAANRKDSALDSPVPIAPVSPTAAAAADAGQPMLQLSQAAFAGLRALCENLLDQAEPSMHVAPVLSVLKSARSVRCTEQAAGSSAVPASPSKPAAATSSTATPKSKKKGRKSSESSPAAASAAVEIAEAGSDASGPTLYAALIGHSLFSQARWYDGAYLSELARLYNKHALVHRWQSDKEQRQKANQQRAIAFGLLKAHTTEMAELGRIDDQQVVNFVAKHSSVNQLDASAQADLISSIPSFARLGLTNMPLLAGTAAPLNVSSSPSAAGAQLPVALPVATPVAQSTQ